MSINSAKIKQGERYSYVQLLPTSSYYTAYGIRMQIHRINLLSNNLRVHQNDAEIKTNTLLLAPGLFIQCQ